MKKLSHSHKNPKHSLGFTILELLIVIVIIGILATVTITTYIGIVPSSRDVSLQSDLSNASDQLVIDQAQASDHKFPIDLAHASATIKFSGGTTNTYVVDNTDTPKTFCLTATNNNQSYFITQEGKPLPGPCPVLYLDAGIPTSYPGTGTYWTDLSGNGNNGRLVNSVGVPTQFTFSSANGGALTFDGNSYANVTSTSALNFSTNGRFSISVWIKPNTISSAWRRGVIVQESYLNSGYRMGLSNGGAPMFWTTQSGGTLQLTSSQALTINQWANVAVTYNNQQSYIYVNGVQKGSATGTYIAGSNSVRIGAAVSEYYSGLVGGVSVYSSSLTATEVQQIFDNIHGRYGI